MALYATTGAASTASSLYTIDPVTAAPTLIGATGMNRVTGISFHPTTGVLYAVNNTNGVRTLVTIDTATGTATTVGALGILFSIPDTAFNAAGVLYGCRDGGMYTIDLTTGAATPLTTSGIFPSNAAGDHSSLGIEFDAFGVLWLKTNINVYTVDVSVSPIVATLVTAITGDTNSSLTFNSTGTAYTRWSNFETESTKLLTIDLVTGIPTTVGDTGINNINSLAFEPSSCPTTVIKDLSQISTTVWEFSDGGDPVVTEITFQGGPNCTDFSLSGTLADTNTFSMTSPTSCNCYAWSFVSGVYTATVYAEPAAVINLVATSGDSTVHLTWDIADGASTYNIYRGDTSGSETLLHSGNVGTTYDDNTAVNNNTYYYIVKAVNGGLTGVESNEVTGTPLAIPGQPINLIVWPADGLTQATWTGVGETSTYNIYRGDTPGNETLYETGVTGTEFSDFGVTNGTTYYYQVSGVNANDDEGPLSTEKSGTPISGGLSATNIENVSGTGTTLTTGDISFGEGEFLVVFAAWGTIAAAFDKIEYIYSSPTFVTLVGPGFGFNSDVGLHGNPDSTNIGSIWTIIYPTCQNNGGHVLPSVTAQIRLRLTNSSDASLVVYRISNLGIPENGALGFTAGSTDGSGVLKHPFPGPGSIDGTIRQLFGAVFNRSNSVGGAWNSTPAIAADVTLSGSGYNANIGLGFNAAAGTLNEEMDGLPMSTAGYTIELQGYVAKTI